jgi:uncharacterized protein (TIGR03067 family)
MKWLVISFSVVALLGVSGCSESRSPRGAAHPVSRSRRNADLEKLQGTWRIESSTWNGVADPEIAKSVTVQFQGDKFIVIDIDGNRQEETIKLMTDQNPKAIDCASKGGGQPAPGIYSLEGDTFKWCTAGGSNKVRPTTFSSQPGSKQSLMVLRRAKK